jgi:thiamine-phosphate pyrophosphorylase
MLVTDRALLHGRSLAGLARAAAAAGVELFQVRARDLGGGALLALVRGVVEAAAGTALRVLVNGRPDVAVLAGADGVHLPESGLPAGEVRRAFPALMVGVSCHDPQAVARAGEAGADYALLGPVFATVGKDRPLGTGALQRAVRAAPIPVLAIGGIEPRTAAAAWAAGAHGLAAIRALHAAPLEAAARALRRGDVPPA